MITGIDTVLCQTDDMDRAVAFYRDVLGLTPTHTSEHYSGFRIGEVGIGLHPRMEGEPGRNTGNWIVGMAVRNLDEFRDRVRSAGGWCADEYHAIPGGRLLDFRDPDGNALQAIQRG